MDHGRERIEDDAEAAAVRRQARRVHRNSAIAAVVLTALAIALP